MRFQYATGEQPLRGYTIRRGLGRGGFGEVYLAVSDGGKEVALKLVQRHLDVELRGVGQCLNLKHPNLVIVYDVRRAENDDTWVVMEYVAGETLDEVLARHPRGMPEPQVIAWVRGIGAGVEYLHDHGLVHRDLKPGNLFLDRGAVKIGDYGLTKFISASRRSGHTESVGTVHYMAPEVSRGRYGKEVDQYALGVILYEMLTGRVPFDGESPGEILMKHLTADPDLGPLPAPYRPIVARLLAKEPARRFPSVRDLLAALPDFGPDRPSEVLRTAPPGPGRPEQPETRSHVSSPDPRPADEPRREEPGPRRAEGSPFATARLVQILAEYGVVDVEAIARILRTFGEGPEQGAADKVTAVRILFENGVEAVEDGERVLSALAAHPVSSLPGMVTAVRILVENGVERGQDITRVLHALGQHPEGSLSDLVALVRTLVENGMERGRDVARVLSALGEYPGHDLPAAVRAVREMAENGLGAREIERALRAAAHRPSHTS